MGQGKKKSKILRRYRDLNIRQKIILSTYAVLFPLLIIASVLIFFYNYSNTLKDDTQLYERLTKSVCDEIDYMEQDALDISDYFAVNRQINNVLLDEPENVNNAALFWKLRTPITFLEDILAIKSQIKTVILYPESGAEVYYQSRDGSVHNTNIEEIRRFPIYEKAIEAQGDVVWQKVPANERGIYIRNRSDKVIACRELYNLSKSKRIGFLAIGLDASRYTESCQSMLQAPNEGMVVLDSTGEVFAQVGEIKDKIVEDFMEREELQPTSKQTQFRYQANGYYIFGAKSTQTDGIVCYMSPKTNWTKQAKGNLAIPIVLFIALLVGAWPLSLLMSNSIVKPIAKLGSSMEKFRNGDFEQQTEVYAQDEIGQLAEAFNKMVGDIKTLINENYVIALKEKEIELNALQAQINPHFLYNVLDSLYWQAMGADNEELAEDILSLSKLFRLLLSQGQSRIRVAKEIELITCYLQIQKMRFAKKLDYKIDVEKDIQDCMISKLLLQPFVENAIVHGLEAVDKEGMVTVSGREEDGYLTFLIEDNGIGMDQEEADQILLADSEYYAGSRIGHYAIHNIKERLQLRYEDDFVLKIFSKVNEGTKVIIRIPKE
ncbi:MAG: sensor histidine kinase [Lachnospiraceae bacterium]|nr:sensor histidine kinase [Lachnospiraceae bacterium]